MTVATCTTLSNGFRIVTEHMPGLKSASIGDLGHRGRAARDGPSRTASRISSNTWRSRAPTRRTPLQIAEAIEDVGGYINAYTTREMTAYYARVLADDVPLALDVIADILLNPVVRPGTRSRSSAA